MFEDSNPNQPGPEIPERRHPSMPPGRADEEFLRRVRERSQAAPGSAGKTEDPTDEADGAGSGRRERRVVRRRRRKGSSSASSSSRGSLGRKDLERFAEKERHRTNTFWVGMLVLLIVAALGFGAWMHFRQVQKEPLAMEAPSTSLEGFFDPVFAPLETGPLPYDFHRMEELAEEFRQQAERVGIDDRDIFTTAIALCGVLRDAIEDRATHLEKLARIAEAEPDANKVRHLELAVSVSWQRNSASFRDKAERLWTKLAQLEAGRFRVPVSGLESQLPAAGR